MLLNIEHRLQVIKFSESDSELVELHAYMPHSPNAIYRTQPLDPTTDIPVPLILCKSGCCFQLLHHHHHHHHPPLDSKTLCCVEMSSEHILFILLTLKSWGTGVGVSVMSSSGAVMRRKSMCLGLDGSESDLQIERDSSISCCQISSCLCRASSGEKIPCISFGSKLGCLSLL